MAQQYQYDPISGQPMDVKIPGQSLIQKGMGFVQNFTGDPFLGVSNIKFIQTEDWIECFCPCCGEKANQYQLFATEATGVADLSQLGTIVEEAKCFSKFMCQCWRPWTQTFFSLHNTPIFKAQRDYKIPSVFCMPCARPEIVVTQEDKVIGFVRQPYMCCGRSACPCLQVKEIDICDDQGNVIYYVSATCCQSGIWARVYICPRCCGPCQFIRFEIFSPTKDKIGEITNQYNGCVQECYTKADRFVLKLPDKAGLREKILLVVATLNIDYDIFENTCGNLP